MAKILKEYKAINKKPYVPTWVGWFSVFLIVVLLFGLGFSLFKSISGHFDSILLVTLGLCLVILCICLFLAGRYEWDIGRKLTILEGNRVCYIYFTPLVLMGTGKCETEIKSIKDMEDRGTYLLIHGDMTITDSPFKPKELNTLKLRLDFEDKDAVLRILEKLIK